MLNMFFTLIYILAIPLSHFNYVNHNDFLYKAYLIDLLIHRHISAK